MNLMEIMQTAVNEALIDGVDDPAPRYALDMFDPSKGIVSSSFHARSWQIQALQYIQRNVWGLGYWARLVDDGSAAPYLEVTATPFFQRLWALLAQEMAAYSTAATAYDLGTVRPHWEARQMFVYATAPEGEGVLDWIQRWVRQSMFGRKVYTSTMNDTTILLALM